MASKGPSPFFRDFRILHGYVRPYRTRFISAVVASTVSMLFGLMFPFLVGHLLDAALPSVKETRLLDWHPTVNTVALVLLGTLAVQAVMMFFSSYWFRMVGESSVMQLRSDLFGRLISLPMKFFGEHRVGELTSRVSNDLALIQDTLSDTVPQFIRQGALLLGGAAFIAATSLKLSLVMISSFPLLMLMAVFFGKRIRKQSRAAQDRLAESTTVVEETLQGISSVKAYGNEPYEHRRYLSFLQIFLSTSLRAAKLRAGLISFIIIGIFGSIILVLWYGARLMEAGELTQGELTRFIIYTMFVGGSVASFAEVFSQIQKTMGATERVHELLSEPTEMGLDAAAAPVASPAGDSEIVKGEASLREVYFSYPSRPDVEVLRGVTLEAHAGEKIAIVGASGAGKSTLVALLLGFYEPDRGSLLFDGKSVKELGLQSVRARSALVPQEVLLFGGTIFENIAYGKPGASEEEVVAASKLANCHEFILRFPEGYETLVGDRGVKLSGGQRQRIAIARALLKDPKILILDEATSSLDSESEKLIQEALDVLMQGRTAFIIAHRLATVRYVDRIYVLDQGRVAESGTHAELIAKGGIYQRLCELQFAD